jgi:hypothetical protein
MYSAIYRSIEFKLKNYRSMRRLPRFDRAAGNGGLSQRVAPTHSIVFNVITPGGGDVDYAQLVKICEGDGELGDKNE